MSFHIFVLVAIIVFILLTMYCLGYFSSPSKVEVKSPTQTVSYQNNMQKTIDRLKELLLGSQKHQQRPQNESWRQNNNQGNKSNRNGQTCIFCKLQNHRQKECHKRIKATEPWLGSNGRPFWPKVNAADSNPTNSVEALTVTFQDFQWWAWWNPYIKPCHSSVNIESLWQLHCDIQ